MLYSGFPYAMDLLGNLDSVTKVSSSVGLLWAISLLFSNEMKLWVGFGPHV